MSVAQAKFVSVLAPSHGSTICWDILRTLCCVTLVWFADDLFSRFILSILFVLDGALMAITHQQVNLLKAIARNRHTEAMQNAK